MIRVGLVGYGRAGKAVARILAEDPRFDLRWIARNSVAATEVGVPSVRLTKASFPGWLDENPVDAMIDFSSVRTIHAYGEAIRARGIMLLTAISNYPEKTKVYIRDLGKDIRAMYSPNITLGINFLIFAAKTLRKIAPFADVEIIEQHFRDKTDVSGTARKMADELEINEARIVSLRLGGIVGHHEVVFGFPHQTVRLTHDSIRREAFGTGAAFALHELNKHPPGFFTFEDLLLNLVRRELFPNAPEISHA